MIHVLMIIQCMGLDTVVALHMNITTYGKQSCEDVPCSCSTACLSILSCTEGFRCSST